ncbi:hypothetical protein CIHG_09858 [Coccidioides immitis H538.4]|uniref:Uncharacterized protein n=2 Tax=Coccidioides immitis TaxID=5501 RepID=A0A0J8S6X1_COCIT|nr:hypothetical protein CIRG_02494 [Coccidioides immitis RMSCC 2394]KMU92104.1 hypothetical protein CIHG_09858 [Coccidioides immitis H538.4]
MTMTTRWMGFGIQVLSPCNRGYFASAVLWSPEYLPFATTIFENGFLNSSPPSSAFLDCILKGKNKESTRKTWKSSQPLELFLVYGTGRIPEIEKETLSLLVLAVLGANSGSPLDALSALN